MASTFTLSQDLRLKITRQALWFAALHYVPSEGKILACIDVDEAAQILLGILDDTDMLRPLSIT